MEKRIELEKRARKANQIQELNLDNCRSTSIVGLTDEYTALESLSLINVGLTTLKGFPKLPNLKKLELSDNRISNGLNYLITSPKLKSLNLSGNKIKDLETLKPLEDFKYLEVLDLFNNDATQVENYREKIFKMIPSLKFLDGFDCNEEEAQSEGEDDDEVNGNSDDDKQNAFCLNGLEINLAELEILEKRVQAKKQQQNQMEKLTMEDKKEDDDLDELLKELKLKEEQQITTKTTVANGNTTLATMNETSTQEQQTATATTPTVSNTTTMNFAMLLYWFLAILNLANFTYFSGEEEDDDDSEGGGEENSDFGEVSLAEVYNDDLEEDNSDWNDENDSGEDDDDDEDSDIDDADDANESAASAKATSGKDGEKDDSQVRGKKRKHDG